jgi:hypothetical protein
MEIWLRGLKRLYLVLGGVAVGRGFGPQSDMELFSAKIINLCIYEWHHYFRGNGGTFDATLVAMYPDTLSKCTNNADFTKIITKIPTYLNVYIYL